MIEPQGALRGAH